MNRIERKSFGGVVLETKTENRNGVDVGVVAGHLAAWSPDEGGRYGKPDRFHKGAFLKSIREHKQRGNRPIRLRDNHGRTVGGFPIDRVREDDIGLYGEGEINLKVQQGIELYSLAQQGIFTDFSIGFIATDDKLGPKYREIYEADIIESSLTDEPVNRDATVKEVKSATSFEDFQLAPQDREFNIVEAKSRLRDFTGSEEVPSDELRSHYLWCDEAHPDQFDSYLFPITDVVEGKSVVIPQALFAAAGVLLDGDGGIPNADRPQVIRHLERYYAKLGVPSPFDLEEKQFYGSIEVQNLDRRSVERVLVQSGCFSKKAAVFLAGRLIVEKPCYDAKVTGFILENLKGIGKKI